MSVYQKAKVYFLYMGLCMCPCAHVRTCVARACVARARARVVSMCRSTWRSIYYLGCLYKGSVKFGKASPLHDGRCTVFRRD